LPAPLAGHVEPLVAVHVQLIVPLVAGGLSVTVTPSALDGPLFAATTVYVIGPPGDAVVFVAPSVFVIERSPCGVSVSVSFAELLVGSASVTPTGAVHCEVDGGVD
jgi:hypothetical protein